MLDHTIPSMGKMAHSWAQASQQAIEVDELDRGLLDQASRTFQLATESARAVLLPNSAHRITVMAKDLGVQLRTLVNRGKVAAARELLERSHAAAAEPQWTEVLALPSTSSRPHSGRADFSQNAEWLRRNRASFTGMWVALYEGRLVDHDASRLALHRRLQAAGKLTKGTLFTKVD